MAKSESKTKKRRIKFSLESPDAQKVSLVGDFNKWDEKTLCMKKNKNGTWEKTTLLPPGRYEYRFFVDGEWRNDPTNDLVCPNNFGTQNNVINI